VIENQQTDILSMSGLRAQYGKVEALHSVDLRLGEGELVTVLGPNGAGKSTLMRAIMGVCANSGQVRFRGKDTPRNNPVALASDGIILVPEGRGILGPMTVEENLEIGGYLLGGRNVEFERRLAEVLEIFPRLRERLSQEAGSLSGGEQQMLAVGRALMAAPKLLLLDEPSLGLAPRIIGEILESLRELNTRGLSILLVEQKAPLALKIANRAYFLSLGKIASEFDPKEISSHEELSKHYLS
tara:strand:+ start:6390 stop:7115 length:726 start_codon:yes stop_codon:yes gene_type:complete